jgi:hypothetical protein
LIEFTRQELETVLMMDAAARFEENPLQQIHNKHLYLEADIP